MVDKEEGMNWVERVMGHKEGITLDKGKDNSVWRERE